MNNRCSGIVIVITVVAAMDCVVKALSRQQRQEREEQIEGQYIYVMAMNSQSYHQLLKTTGIEIIAVKKSCSIRLYFLCESLESLWELRKLFESGQLKLIIEQLFNSWLTIISSAPVDSPSTNMLLEAVDAETRDVSSTPVTSTLTDLIQLKPVLLTHLSLINYSQAEDIINNGLKAD